MQIAEHLRPAAVVPAQPRCEGAGRIRAHAADETPAPGGAGIRHQRVADGMVQAADLLLLTIGTVLAGWLHISIAAVAGATLLVLTLMVFALAMLLLPAVWPL